MSKLQVFLVISLLLLSIMPNIAPSSPSEDIWEYGFDVVNWLYQVVMEGNKIHQGCVLANGSWTVSSEFRIDAACEVALAFTYYGLETHNTTFLQKAVALVKQAMNDSQIVYGKSAPWVTGYSPYKSVYTQDNGRMLRCISLVYNVTHDAEIFNRLVDLANFWVSVIPEDGGVGVGKNLWLRDYLNPPMYPCARHIGELLVGMVEAYQVTGNSSYKQASEKMGNWLVNTQKEDGHWHVWNETWRDYNGGVGNEVEAASLSLRGLSALYTISPQASYNASAFKGYQWLMSQCEQANSNWGLELLPCEYNRNPNYAIFNTLYMQTHTGFTVFSNVFNVSEARTTAIGIVQFMGENMTLADENVTGAIVGEWDLQNNTRSQFKDEENMRWGDWAFSGWTNCEFVEACGLLEPALPEEVVPINADPSTVFTTNQINAIGYPFQHKTYYCANNSKHYVYGGDNEYFRYSFSDDALSWTNGFPTGIYTAITGLTGSYFDVAYNGNSQFYITKALGITFEWKKGTVQSNGNLTLSGSSQILPQQAVGTIYPYSGFYPAKTLVSGNIYTLSALSGLSSNYETNVTAGTLNYFYMFSPYQASSAGVASEPSTVQNMGWMTHVGYWLMEGRLTVSLTLRNAVAAGQTGVAAFRLWKDDDFNFGSPTALCSWQTSTVTFNGVLNQIVDVTKSVDILNPVGSAWMLNNETLYMECYWQPTNSTVGKVMLEASLNTDVYIPSRTYKFPTIALDSEGYPWFGIVGDAASGGSACFPYLVCNNAKASVGSTTQHLVNVTKLSTTSKSLFGWTVVPITLSSDRRVIVVYNYGSTNCFSQYYCYSGGWNNTEIGVYGASLQSRNYCDGVAGNDTLAFFAYLMVSTYDIGVSVWNATINDWDTLYSPAPSQTSTSAPVLSFDNGTNKALYCFWLNSNHVYYRNWTEADGWNYSSWDWITETAISGNQYLSCSPYSFGNVISLVYMNQTLSPYDIRYAFLTISVPSEKTWHSLFLWEIFITRQSQSLVWWQELMTRQFFSIIWWQEFELESLRRSGLLVVGAALIAIFMLGFLALVGKRRKRQTQKRDSE